MINKIMIILKIKKKKKKPFWSWIKLMDINYIVFPCFKLVLVHEQIIHIIYLLTLYLIHRDMVHACALETKAWNAACEHEK